MYADEPCGAGELGTLLDRCFLNQPAAQALRNFEGCSVRSCSRLSPLLIRDLYG